jgi:hypothetical protein
MNIAANYVSSAYQLAFESKRSQTAQEYVVLEKPKPPTEKEKSGFSHRGNHVNISV